MEKAYISVGSNLGNREESCRRAIEAISDFAVVTAVSSLYETEPVGKEDQPLFINAAVEIETELTPHELLDKLQSVESKLGRVRQEWGQRRALHSDAGEGIESSRQRRALHSDAGEGIESSRQRRALHSDAGEGIESSGQRRALHSDAGEGIESSGQRRALHSDAGEGIKWGPRIIDLDIIFYGSEIINGPDLKVPHPEAHKRRFVLEPIAEIAPGFVHPSLKLTIKELLNSLSDPHKVVKLDVPSTLDPQ